MTDNTPQDPRGIERLALLAITLALPAVPFVGLALDAPWYWYPLAVAYLWLLPELGGVQRLTTALISATISVWTHCLSYLPRKH